MTLTDADLAAISGRVERATEGQLVHYSHEPLSEVRSVEQEHQGHRYDKPRGLWVSVTGPDDWKAWCEAEKFALDRMSHETAIVLADGANVLRLCSAFEIDGFTREYRSETEEWRNYSIDWRRVAARYDGIIIAPYIWTRRLDGGAGWYYGWDCASGCIWNARAIAALRPLPSAGGK